MRQTTRHFDFGQLTSVEIWDTDAQTYSVYDGDEELISSRPFSDDETSFYAEQANALAQAQAEQAAIQAAPSLANRITALETTTAQLAQAAGIPVTSPPTLKSLE